MYRAFHPRSIRTVKIERKEGRKDEFGEGVVGEYGSIDMVFLMIGVFIDMLWKTKLDEQK